MSPVYLWLCLFHMALFAFGSDSEPEGVLHETLSSAPDIIKEMDEEYNFGGDGASMMSDGEPNNNQDQTHHHIFQNSKQNSGLVDSKKYAGALSLIGRIGGKRQSNKSDSLGFEESKSENNYVDYEELNRLADAPVLIERNGRKRNAPVLIGRNGRKRNAPVLIGRNGRKRNAPGLIGRNGKKRENNFVDYEESNRLDDVPALIGRNGRKRNAPGLIGRNGKKREHNFADYEESNRLPGAPDRIARHGRKRNAPDLNGRNDKNRQGDDVDFEDLNNESTGFPDLIGRLG